MRAKGYGDMEVHAAPWTGEQEFAEIVEAIEARNGQRAPPNFERKDASSTPEVIANAVSLPTHDAVGAKEGDAHVGADAGDSVVSVAADAATEALGGSA